MKRTSAKSRIKKILTQANKAYSILDKDYGRIAYEAHEAEIYELAMKRLSNIQTLCKEALNTRQRKEVRK